MNGVVRFNLNGKYTERRRDMGTGGLREGFPPVMLIKPLLYADSCGIYIGKTRTINQWIKSCKQPNDSFKIIE